MATLRLIASAGADTYRVDMIRALADDIKDPLGAVHLIASDTCKVDAIASLSWENSTQDTKRRAIDHIASDTYKVDDLNFEPSVCRYV